MHDHSRFVRLLGRVHHGDKCWLVLEFGGQSVEAKLKGEPQMERHRRLELAIGRAAALQAATSWFASRTASCTS
jgi:hypothetical protein